MLELDMLGVEDVDVRAESWGVRLPGAAGAAPAPAAGREDPELPQE